MRKKMMYCRKCGEQLEEDAAFCRYCGCRVDEVNNEAEADTESEAIGDVRRKSAERRRKRSQNPKSSGSSSTKNGVILLAATLVVAVFAVTAFKYPGFLLPSDSGGSQIDYTATAETETLSPEKLTASFEESGVSVALTEWILDEGQEETLSVESISPLYDPNGDYVIKPYEVSLGDIHELTDFIEIRIPYDTTFCEAGEDPTQCVGGLYYNEENSAWEEVLYTVDAEAGEIVIETDHFSKFGAITLKNKGRRDAMLCMAKDKVTENFDIGYLDEEQAVQVMRNLCDTEDAVSETAKLAGNQVLQQAMDLGGSVNAVSDGLGAAFSFAYYLDLSDLAMAGRYTDTKPMFWVQGIPFGTMVDTSASYSNNMFNAYPSDMVDKAGKTLSRVGNAVSGCKLVYLAAKAGSGNAEDSEIWDLYKESAGMAVNIGGGATLGALMGPVFLADAFLNYIYEDAMDIKESQIEEMYIYFNTEYPGCSYPAVRAGRSAKDWRDVIIKLIEENPEADTAELLEKEIDSFANEFWTLNSDQMADVVAQMPKTIKRITVDDERIREKITNGYKEELYAQMTGVLTSVRNYYNKQMVLKTEQQISSAIGFYNKTITFDIVEEDPEKEVRYGGCKCIFAPLYEDAEVSNWTSTLPENGPGLTGEMTLIGHITSGSPTHLLVFDKDADMTEDEPILTVPFEIDKDNHIQIILKESEDDSELAYCLDTTVFESHWDTRNEDTLEDKSTGDIVITDSTIVINSEDEYGNTSQTTYYYPGEIVKSIGDFNDFKADGLTTIEVYTSGKEECEVVYYNNGAFLQKDISSCIDSMNPGDVVCIQFSDIALRYVCMSTKEAEGKAVNHIEEHGLEYAWDGKWK